MYMSVPTGVLVEAVSTDRGSQTGIAREGGLWNEAMRQEEYRKTSSCGVDGRSVRGRSRVAVSHAPVYISLFLGGQRQQAFLRHL